MRVLTIDVGNTTLDLCIFEDGTPKHLGRFSHSIHPPQVKYNLAVAVSVKPSFNDRLKEMFENLRLITKEDIPIEVIYETPQTLGTDRVLLAYGVKNFYSPDAVLVSAGTALVVDLMIDGVFMGGFITVGLRTKLSCLSSKAEGIPTLEPEKLEVSLGKSTRECILGGSFLESKFFIERTAKRWSKEFKRNLGIYITGGDGYLLKDLGTYDPLLLHKAMHRIIINP
ncbi:MAG: type III pantothenate kinase [Aquificae bacterium]|nr:type III pantothenate kinase [Aquificota bacterium]